MSVQRPRQGWIYKIDPYLVSLSCSKGHRYLYNVTTEPQQIICQHSGCNELVNPSRVFRGLHYYIVWLNDEFIQTYQGTSVFHAIPLTSQTTFFDFPTTYPLTPNSKNNLPKKSYALVHQLTLIDANSFIDTNGDWLSRVGSLGSKDKQYIKQRLNYLFDLDSDQFVFSEDWFRSNASPELIKEMFSVLPDTVDKEKLINDLIDQT